MDNTLNQREQYAREGFMIIPGFLEREELGMIQGICDESIVQIEKDMQAKGLKEYQINVLGKKYFLFNDIYKTVYYGNY